VPTSKGGKGGKGRRKKEGKEKGENGGERKTVGKGDKGARTGS